MQGASTADQLCRSWPQAGNAVPHQAAPPGLSMGTSSGPGAIWCDTAALQHWADWAVTSSCRMLVDVAVTPEHGDKGWSCPLRLRQLEMIPWLLLLFKQMCRSCSWLSASVYPVASIVKQLFSHVSCQQRAKIL